jgi:hypothetical protein
MPLVQDFTLLTFLSLRAFIITCTGILIKFFKIQMVTVKYILFILELLDLTQPVLHIDDKMNFVYKVFVV